MFAKMYQSLPVYGNILCVYYVSHSLLCRIQAILEARHTRFIQRILGGRKGDRLKTSIWWYPNAIFSITFRIQSISTKGLGAAKVKADNGSFSILSEERYLTK
jgi:hypothetical protein